MIYDSNGNEIVSAVLYNGQGEIQTEAQYYDGKGQIVDIETSDDPIIDYPDDGYLHPKYHQFLGNVPRVQGGGAFQGAVYKNGRIYQFLDGGTIMVIVLSTMQTLKTIALPTGYGNDHFNCVDWYNKQNSVIITNEGEYTYIYDISDPTDITVATIHDGVEYSGGGGFDPVNKIYYKFGYKDKTGTRSHICVTPIDFGDYDSNGTITVGTSFDVEARHYQDSMFYNGKLYVLCDRPTGPNAGAYSIFGIQIIDVESKTESLINASMDEYYEAESIVIVDDAVKPYFIASYCVNWANEYYYKVVLNDNN